MNEKIKLVVKNNGNPLLSYYYDESCTIYTEKKLVFTEEDVKQKCNDAYLQGAKDMKEAVKPTNQAEASWCIGYDKSYHQHIIDVFAHKAQQFLDSLEKGTNNE